MKSKPPPLVLKPEKFWLLDRCFEIAEAVNRYQSHETKMRVPQEWIDELERHHARLDEIKKQGKGEFEKCQ